MLIEDLYNSVEKIEKHLDDMKNNKVNITFIRQQLDKALEDIEKLKDADREIVYKNVNNKNDSRISYSTIDDSK